MSRAGVIPLRDVTCLFPIDIISSPDRVYAFGVLLVRLRCLFVLSSIRRTLSSQIYYEMMWYDGDDDDDAGCSCCCPSARAFL